MKTLSTFAAGLLPVALAGCAGPVGAPLGLGPGMDSLGGLLILCGVGFLIWRSTRGIGVSARTGDTDAPSRASALLRERYVKGEISREEFVAMRDDIEGRGNERVGR